MSSPKVVLYDYPTSICSQMARLALLEKGVPFERRNIDIMKKAEQFEPWNTALNPKAVVPTLEIATNRYRYGSHCLSDRWQFRRPSPHARRA